jgi:uncharacterized RDD family membrane protein YckC
MTATSFRVGFWPRLAAATIDYAIIVAVCTIAGAAAWGPLRAPAGAEARWNDGLTIGLYLGALAGLTTGFSLVGALYMSVEVWTDRTPGKRLLGLVVASEDGHPAASGARVARYLVKNCHLLLASLASLSGMWFVGLLAPLATLVVAAGGTMILMSQRQALHDVIAKTAVLRRQPLRDERPGG